MYFRWIQPNTRPGKLDLVFLISQLQFQDLQVDRWSLYITNFTNQQDIEAMFMGRTTPSRQ